MSAFRLRKSWVRLLAAVSGAVFLGGCGVTSLQFRDFLSSTLVRTFWTSVSSYVQAVVIDRAQNQQGG